MRLLDGQGRDRYRRRAIAIGIADMVKPLHYMQVAKLRTETEHSVRRLNQMIILKKEILNHTTPPVFFYFQICISHKVA